MLDFDGQDLYFDEPLDPEAVRLIQIAAERYEDAEAESPLMRAYFLAPEHPVVLVALYRYFYYQHRYADALIIGERILDIFGERLNLPGNWEALEAIQLEAAGKEALPVIRFYLLALKGTGYLEMRLGNYAEAIRRLEKVAELDTKDRLGAEVLLEVARESLPDVVAAVHASGG